MNTVWQDIKDRLPIEDVIQDYIPVINQGNSYKAICPFHREKNPSLLISKEKGIWHCFGCGQGGDAFAFVMQIENITKKEALEKLAKKAGVKLDDKEYKKSEAGVVEDRPKDKSRHEQGSKLLEWTAQVYHKVLLKVLQDRQNPITQYYLERGLSQDIIEQFKLGYAPRGNFLLQLVKQHNLNGLLMLEIGVLKIKSTVPQNPTGVDPDISMLSDKFADRLMIPVFDKQGKIAGFTGRVLPYDKTERPKYLNSPQTTWFNKSDLWYGWHLAKSNIIQQKKAIIVEGNMDVISSFKHNFNFTLASQGTSFTENQLKLLKTITKVVWLAFDNDEAGKVSADKFFKSATSYNIVVNKVLIPEKYKDLDDYLSAQKPDKLDVAPYLDWVLSEKKLSMQSNDASIQRSAILDFLELIKNLDDLSKEQYLTKLSEISKISIATLEKIAPDAEKRNNLDFSESEAKASQLTEQQSVYSSWQELTAGVIYNKPENLDILQECFLILSKILPQLQEFGDFNEYLTTQSDMLNFILQEKSELGDGVVMLSNWRKINGYIDTKFNDLIFYSDLKDAYVKLKAAKFI